MREGNLHSLLQGSSGLVSSANTEADPLLSSFMYNPPANDDPVNIQPHSSDKAFSVEDNFVESSSKRYELWSKCLTYSFLIICEGILVDI